MENKEFLKYANSFQAVAKLGLENMTALMQNLGNPQDELKFIHIAGTNGKGSVCAFLQCIFMAAGYKTGKYISPNLIDVCERISVDGENIKKDELEKIMETVKSAAEKTEKETGIYPTQFELWTAAAFLYFKNRKTDVVILETGLGGEKDATNIIKSNLCAVITKIAADHKDYLGSKTEDIAAAKSGIIKAGSFVVSAPQISDAEKVIKQKCQILDVPHTVAETCTNVAFDKEEFVEIFDYQNIKSIKMRLLGLHQTENAALAITAAKKLGIKDEHIKQGIFAAQNPARFEIVSKEPFIIFDGAHNPNGVSALCKALKRYFPDRKFNFITAAMADKDYEENFKILGESGFKNCPVKTLQVKNNSRSATGEVLADSLRVLGFFAEGCKDFEEAFEKINKSDITVIFGSLYLYKDFKEFWDKQN